MNIVVFSGGTATNSLTPCFSKISVAKNYELTYVLPISDNGGSTSEILRVVGGPAIGDMRSRIVRLVKDKQLAHLLSYRLPNDRIKAKEEWNGIVEGHHSLWHNVPTEVKEICRAFFIHVQSELLKRTKISNPFRFEMASIGNFFLTGARLFLGSLDASIELMMRIGRCDSHVHVIPCINTNHTHHISALLTNGEVITGQSQISHPSKPSFNKEQRTESTADITRDGFIHLDTPAEINYGNNGVLEEEEEEYANPIYILPELKNSQLHFDKLNVEVTLPAPIKRLLYINPYGEEIKPMGNSRAISKIKKADMVVYSIGSLVTSLLPIVILGNIADIISESDGIHKVLLVNNKYDRETCWLDGITYVQLLVESMSRAVRKYRQSKASLPCTDGKLPLKWSIFVTDIVYLTKGAIQINENFFAERGVKCHKVDSDKMENELLADVLTKINSCK